MLSKQSISTVTANESCRILGTQFTQSVCQTERGKKPHDPSPNHPDQGHLAQPLLEACASVLHRQRNSFDYGFTEYLQKSPSKENGLGAEASKPLNC